LQEGTKGGYLKNPPLLLQGGTQGECLKLPPLRQ